MGIPTATIKWLLTLPLSSGRGPCHYQVAVTLATIKWQCLVTGYLTFIAAAITLCAPSEGA